MAAVSGTLVLAGAAVLPTAASAAGGPSTKMVSDPAALVNPFIGSTNGGDTFPAADAPLGMIQWGPTTPNGQAGGGYYYNDSQLDGFSLTHMSGPGCGAENDIPILPTTGSLTGTDPSNTTETFSHSTESASPGYYQVTAGGVKSQMAVTERSGIANFTFPSTSAANLLFKLDGSQSTDNSTLFKVISKTEVEGQVQTGYFCGAGNMYTLHFVMKFNHPFTAHGTWTSQGVQAGTDSLRAKLAAAAVKRDRNASSLKRAGVPVSGADGAYVTFNASKNQTVTAKVGISFVSDANAAQNLRAEIPAWNLNKVKTATTHQWNSVLDRIQVAGGTATQQAVFYSSLYRSMISPNVQSDVNGQYMGYDGQVHTAPKGHAEYSNFSGWDIYRSEIPLEAMLAPKQTSDIVSSILDDYNETGMMPKWAENNGESYVMVGDPSDGIIAGASAFGANGFDHSAALKAMVHEADTPGNIRPGLNYYLKTGYLPMDGSYGCCNFYGNVSTQEEYNVADNAIALYAKALGKTSVAKAMLARVNNWQNVYNPGTGFLQPKLSNGSFEPGFDPTSGTGFVEADAYVYTAELPFDLAGIIKAEGGNANWVKYLDQMNQGFTNPSATESQMGNEPSFDIPWEYDYAGAPYRAQEVVRQVQDQLYLDTPGGLAGNDDLGAMSSWYVFSALGFYPETPGSAQVALGSPMFSKVAIHLGNGKTITESAPAAADNAPYINSMTLNGSNWNNAYLPASLFSKGGALTFKMSTTPNTQFASASTAAPDSSTTGLKPALGFTTGDSAGEIILTPGASSSFKLGVQSMSSQAQAVSWSASVPSGSGVTVGPDSSGTINVGSEAQATTDLTVTAAAGAADGIYPVTIKLTAANGQALPPQVVEVGVAQPGDLTPYFNNSGISNDGTSNDSDYDGDGFSYSAQALAAEGLTAGGSYSSPAGVKYTMPNAQPGAPDNVQAAGQTVMVKQLTGETELGFIGSAAEGPSVGTATVNYTDGSSQQVQLGMSDWTLNAGSSSPSYGNGTVAKIGYRNGSNGTPQTIDTYLFSAEFPLQSGKTVESITLPSSTNQGSIHIFAIGSNAGALTTGS